MLCLAMFDELVLAVVLDITIRALVRLLVDVSTSMIIAVANGCERFGAVTALVRLLACVNSHVHQQVAALVEGLVAPHAAETGRKWIADIHHNVAVLSASLLYLLHNSVLLLGAHRVI